MGLVMKQPAHLGDNAGQPIGRLSYKITEAAELLGVSPTTIRRAIDRGMLNPCRVFRHVLIPVDQLERLIKR